MSGAAAQHSERRRDRLAVLVVRSAAAIVAAVATLAVTRNGLVVSPDSTRYLSGAEGLSSGAGLVNPTGDPLVLFPPGTSLVYSFGELLPGPTLRWVRVVNAAAAAAAVWLTSLLLVRHVRHVGVVLGATVFSSVAVGLLFVTRAAWSEPIFVVSIVGFIVLMSSIIDRPDASHQLIVGAAMTVWAASLLRYAGLVLLPIGVLAIGVDRRRWRHAAEFAVVASAVPLLWLGVNVLRAGSMFGERPPGAETFSAVMRGSAEVIGSWFVPPQVADESDTIRLAIGAVVLCALLAVAAVGLIRMSRSTAGCSDRTAVSVVSSLVALGATAAVVVGELRTALDPVDLRLLSPALLPTVVVLATLVDRAVEQPWGIQRGTRIAAGGAAVALIGVQAAAAQEFVVESRPAQWTYTHPVWTGSEVAAAVRQLPAGVGVWTNDPFAVWALTAKRTIDEVPRSGAYRSELIVDFPADLAVPCELTHLVWFDRAGSYHHVPERIGQVVELSDRVDLADGSIWSIGQHPDCD